MHKLIRAGELPASPSGTVVFEGQAHGAAVCMYLVNNAPGAGPVLHTHPYSETWVIRKGQARLNIAGQTYEAGPGDIGVVGPGVPHKFTNIGSDRLEITCIHASPVFIQEDLE